SSVPNTITVSGTGMGTANAAGASTITAAYSGLTATASLQVYNHVIIWPRVTSISPWQTVQFQATQPSNGSATLTWSVDGVAGGNQTVGLISATGLYSPPSTVGTHTITVAPASSPTASASATVYVTDSPGVLT